LFKVVEEFDTVSHQGKSQTGMKNKSHTIRNIYSFRDHYSDFNLILSVMLF